VKYFLKEMNENAHKLKMSSTHFDSPHGLMNVSNLSTAYDMARLSSVAMKIPLLAKIVKTRTYQCNPIKVSSNPKSLR